MRYFSLLDDLFNFQYLLTKDQLDELPKYMQESMSKIDVVSNISSTLLPESELILRRDRNIELYKHFIDLNKIKTKVSLDKLDDIVPYLKNSPQYDTIITNYTIGVFLLEHPEFKSIDKPNDAIDSAPYLIGTIFNIKIIIDPAFREEENIMIFYNKGSINTAAYIDSIEVEHSEMIFPKLNSKIIAYMSNFIGCIVELKMS